MGVDFSRALLYNRCIMSIRIKKAVTVVIWIVTLGVCLLGCTAQGQSYSVFGLGSVLNAVDYSASKALNEYAKGLIDEVQRAIDPTDETSDIARFNAAADEEPIAVSALTYSLLQAAREAYDLTDGLYDPTVYWAVDLWGFLPRKDGTSAPYDRVQNADGGYPLPQEKYVTAFSMLTDMRKIEAKKTEDGQAYLTKHGSAVTVDGVTYYARIDLGGIAKGYVIDGIRAYCTKHGIRKGYMSFGSSSLLLLQNRKGAEWDLTLTHPRATEDKPYYCALPAKDTAVSTSGDYQNYYMVDGVRYCHLIDPRTGMPKTGELLSVTVLGANATVGDALSTALTVGGLDYLKAFANTEYARANGLDFVAVYQEGEQLKVFTTVKVDIQLSV